VICIHLIKRMEREGEEKREGRGGSGWEKPYVQAHPVAITAKYLG
jgi:hypothetical protein